MKRLLIVFIVFISLFFTSTNVFAREYTATSEDEISAFEYEEYLPDTVKNILNNSFGQAPDSIDVNEVFKIAVNYIKTGLNKHSSGITNLLFIIIIISIFKRINDNSPLLMIINGMFVLIIAFMFLNIFQDAYIEIKSTVESNKELLKALLPSFLAALSLGGQALSSVALSSSFAAVISFLEIVLSDICIYIALLAALLSVFEQISPLLSDISCAKHLKKLATTLITFVSTVLVTVLSYQNLISARADSVTTRSVKFAAANFIPIVGGAVGESLRTVSSGVAYLKSSLGGAASLAIFVTLIPILSELFILKLWLSVTAAFSDICGVTEVSPLIVAFNDVLSIFLSIIISIAVLSLLIIFIFSISIGG